MQLGVTSTGPNVRIGGASTAASAFKKLPGVKKAPATGSGVLSSVVKGAEEAPRLRDRLGGFAGGAQMGAATGGGVGLLTALRGKKGLNQGLARVGGGIIAGGALGGGIGAMTAKQKTANVLGCTLWGTRSSPYAGARTNPFASGILKGANVLGPTLLGDRSSPFVAGGRTNPFAKTPVQAKTASSAEGRVDGMAEAMEEILRDSVTPYRGFDFASQVRGKVAAALRRN